MPSTRAKGNEAEREACELLEKNGYRVWRASAPLHFKQYSSADIFGLYDILAIKDRDIRWIQIRSEPYIRTKMRQEILALWLPGTREVWLKRSGRSLIIKFNELDMQTTYEEV